MSQAMGGQKCQENKSSCSGFCPICWHKWGRMTWLRLLHLETSWAQSWSSGGAAVWSSRPITSWVHTASNTKHSNIHQPGECVFSDVCDMSFSPSVWHVSSVWITVHLQFSSQHNTRVPVTALLSVRRPFARLTSHCGSITVVEDTCSGYQADQSLPQQPLPSSFFHFNQSCNFMSKFNL